MTVFGAAQPAVAGWAIGAFVGSIVALFVGGAIAYGLVAVYNDKSNKAVDPKWYIINALIGAVVGVLLVVLLCVAGYQLQWIDYNRTVPG